MTQTTEKLIVLVEGTDTAGATEGMFRNFVDAHSRELQELYGTSLANHNAAYPDLVPAIRFMVKRTEGWGGSSGFYIALHLGMVPKKATDPAQASRVFNGYPAYLIAAHTLGGYSHCCGLNTIIGFGNCDQLDQGGKLADGMLNFLHELTYNLSSRFFGNPSKRFTGITVYGPGTTDGSMDHSPEYFETNKGQRKYAFYHRFFKENVVVESRAIMKNANSRNLIENVVFRAV